MKIDDIDLRILEAVQTDAGQSNLALAAQVGISAPTCLRRLAQLRQAGFIEREVALLRPEPLAEALGAGLMALIEVSLDRQDAQSQAAFETLACEDPAVQQCWRVTPGPDFMLVVGMLDMTDYQALVERLFTANRNVRNVKTFFSVRRAKFAPRVVLPSSRAPKPDR